jgi:hypothetical protein
MCNTLTHYSTPTWRLFPFLPGCLRRTLHGSVLFSLTLETSAADHPPHDAPVPAPARSPTNAGAQRLPKGVEGPCKSQAFALKTDCLPLWLPRSLW